MNFVLLLFFVIVEVPTQGSEGLCLVGLDLSQDIYQVQVGSVKHIPHNVFNSAIVGFAPPSLAEIRIFPKLLPSARF